MDVSAIEVKCKKQQQKKKEQENPKQMIESNNRVSPYKSHKISRTKEAVSSPKRHFFS